MTPVTLKEVNHASCALSVVPTALVICENHGEVYDRGGEVSRSGSAL